VRDNLEEKKGKGGCEMFQKIPSGIGKVGHQAGNNANGSSSRLFLLRKFVVSGFYTIHSHSINV
jgi:hypothetical protein